MTSTTTDAILLHRVPQDPVRTMLADALREATYSDGGGMGALLSSAAARSGMTMEAAAAALGFRIETSDTVQTPDGPGDYEFTLRIVPDGVRACYRSECTHGPDYDPTARTGEDPAWGEPPADDAANWFSRELQFAINAHEFADSLNREIYGGIFTESEGDFITDDQYARAAQLIACRRNTCGGPGAGHDHIT